MVVGGIRGANAQRSEMRFAVSAGNADHMIERAGILHRNIGSAARLYVEASSLLLIILRAASGGREAGM